VSGEPVGERLEVQAGLVQRMDGIFPARDIDAWEEWETWPRLVCCCGEEASSVREVLLCEHETVEG
jgi:hypothetical protein